MKTLTSDMEEIFDFLRIAATTFIYVMLTIVFGTLLMGIAAYLLPVVFAIPVMIAIVVSLLAALIVKATEPTKLY